MKIVHCHRCGKSLRTDDYNTNGKVYYCVFCAPIVRQEEWDAQHGAKGGWADKDGNVHTEYRDGRIEKKSSKRVTFEFWRTIVILTLIVAATFTGIRY